jgi:hypothetical protein
MSTDIAKKPHDSIKDSIRLELQQQGIHNLGDFVDESSIIEVSTRAE